MSWRTAGQAVVSGIVGAIYGFVKGGPWGAVAGFVIGAGLSLLSSAMQPDVSQPGVPIQQLQMPSNIIGEVIPDVLGTVKVCGTFLCFGHERSEKETTSTGGKGGDETESVTGYRYYMTWAQAICLGPVDTVYSVFKDDDVVLWSGELNRPVSGGMETITVPDYGTISFYFGTTDQAANTAVGGLISDATLNSPLRGLCYAVFNDFYIGEYNRCPAIKFVLKKTPVISALSANNTVGDYDYNPIHALWYVLHDLAGLPDTWLHDADFIAAAATIKTEGLGVSMLLDRYQTAIDYLETINSHINSIIRYGNDGKFHPKLIRNDYTVGTLPLIDESIVLDDPALSRKSWIDTINEVKVQYSEICYPGVGATGGAVYCKNDYIYHVFTKTTDDAPVEYFSLTVNKALTAKILVIAGGGAPPSCWFYGSVWAGGAGAGGRRVFENVDLPLGSYSIQVGGGAWAWPRAYTPSGYDSVFTSPEGELTSTGGGHGGRDTMPGLAGDGGSGGGGWGEPGKGNTPPTYPSQGSDGGSGGEHGNPFGGGGGYTGVGGNGALGTGGYGGAGYLDEILSEIWPEYPSLYCVCGGGNGHGDNSNGSPAIILDLDGKLQYCGGKDYFGGGGNVSYVETNPDWVALGRVGGNGIVVVVYASEEAALNIKQSTPAVNAVDKGNHAIQGRNVSRTIQLACFTNDQNAVWAARENLRRESYPLATISFVANRDAFRYEVGDVFKFSYAKYGVADMVCRVLQIQEEGPESENITITATEDIYSVSSVITEYTVPTNYAGQRQNYLVEAFENQKIFEVPYVLATDGTVKLAPLVCRENSMDMGFNAYLSTDGGSSYQLLSQITSLLPYGELVGTYSADTYAIDDVGLLVDIEQDASLVETSTWPAILAGSSNLALLGDEIISFLTITPVTGIRYQLTNIIRGRFGTQKVSHSDGETLFFLGSASATALLSNAEILPGATRYFKFVPYNLKKSGLLADATALSITIEGKARTPYIPINFAANGGAFAARYDTDCVLTWAPRYRGRGAGIGIPGTVLADSAHEGLFKIEVWVGGSLVRTATAIDAATWTYTAAMNTSDNGSAAASIIFKLSNYLMVGGDTYESDQVSVTCKKNA